MEYMTSSVKNIQYTVVCLKSGLACVGIFGESPVFLDKSFFCENPKVRVFRKSPVIKNMQKLVKMLDPPVRKLMDG